MNATIDPEAALCAGCGINRDVDGIDKVVGRIGPPRDKTTNLARAGTRLDSV